MVRLGDDVSVLASVVAVDGHGRASAAAALLVHAAPCATTAPTADDVGRCDPHAQCWQHVPAAAPLTPDASSKFKSLRPTLRLAIADVRANNDTNHHEPHHLPASLTMRPLHPTTAGPTATQ